MSRWTWVAVGAAVVAAAAGVARADTVILKDGRVFHGRVVERGERVFVEQPLGGTSFERKDVLRIEQEGEGAAEHLVEDLVVLKDGRLLHGDVRFSPDGSEVIVAQGQRGEVSHPRISVAVIRWRDGREEAQGGGAASGASTELSTQLDKLIAELEGESATGQANARRELLALGPFARSYLEQAKAAHPALVKLLEDLDRLTGYRRVLPPRAEQSLPNLQERLIHSDASEREAALRAVAVEYPDDSGPLLLHAVARDGDEKVKAYCISQLAALRRFQELAEVLKLTDGPLRLAAAFALGDAGIYVGIPILIEALRLHDPRADDIRQAALDRLNRWTGQAFGYRLRSTPEERDAAVARWQRWWDENGTRLIREGMKQVAPDLPGGKVSDTDKQEAAQLWTQATRLMSGDRSGGKAEATDEEERLRRERVAELLLQALRLDPSLVTARMMRATLLYEDLGRPEEAEKELSLLIVRAEHDSEDPGAARKYANFHLARIAALRQDWRQAVVRYTQSINYDEDFVEAYEGRGAAYFSLALGGGEAAQGQARQEALESARQSYRGALAAITRQEERLNEIMRDLVTESPDSLEEGRVLQSVRSSSRQLGRNKAEIYFQLGRVSAALQDDERALESYRAALRLAPDRTDLQEAVRAWSGAAAGGER